MARAGHSQQAKLQERFRQFDRDKDGFIDEREFEDVLRSLGEQPLEETLSLQFAAIDADGNGIVTFDEFMKWWLDRDRA